MKCIFCGGANLATTTEHCPPRGLFKDKQWPKGFDFPACGPCNFGTRDDDRLVAMLAATAPNKSEPARLEKWSKLMKGVHRQSPETLQQMFKPKSVMEARSLARRFGLKRGPGQTYQDVANIADIPEALHTAVKTLAAKLGKAVYFQETGNIFPADGGIQFVWFTNAQKLEHGKIVVLEALASTAATSRPLRGNGKDLKDQFDYRYSVDEPGDLHLLQAVFGEVFGFVTIFSQTPGRLEGIENDLSQKLGVEKGPFSFLSSNR
jgi:hypothetical protein